MKRKMFLLMTVLFAVGGLCYSQVELQKVIPLSPNASSLVKYAEMPPGTFSGVPAIGMPIYTIETNGISVPIGLSYHAGGNKVETVSSFVGLGWSVTGVPMITRGVRGIADENGGVFSGYEGLTVKELWDTSTTGGSGLGLWKEYLRAAEAGDADMESDIYYYSLNGKTGKFFYDQESEQFLTYPFENIKISYTTYGDLITFKIIDDNGNQYFFSERETSTTNEDYWGTQRAETVTTGWYCEKILNANRTDSVMFSYSTEETLTLNKRSVSKYIPVSLGSCAGVSVWDVQTSQKDYENVALNIYAIQFSKGRIEFISSDTEREDLTNGYSLDTIVVYNNLNQKIKQLDLHYDYLESGTDCNIYDDTDNKWLLLKEVDEVDVIGGSNAQTYKYTYDETSIPPCKTSAAQDFWGYYNGKDENEDLVPGGFIESQAITGPKPFFGANRFVDTLYTQFGILKKVEYPGGGFTEYEYENNTARDTVLPTRTKSVSADIEGEDPITTNYYSTTFSINNPPDLFLNDNSSNGGALLKVYAGGFGCDLTGGSAVCADIKITGIGNATNIPIWGNKPNNTYENQFYLPNGNYKIEATFDQSPEEYGSFYVLANWSVLDSIRKPYNRLAGGLRVKKILSHDGVSSANDIIKNYRYTINLNSDSTSGRLFGTNSLSFVDNFAKYEWYETGEPSGSYLRCDETYLRLKGYSNAQQVSHSGSFTGYSKVITDFTGTNKPGVTVQDFFSLPDQVKDAPPYTPYETYEHFRGLLLKNTNYRIASNVLYPVSSTAFEYEESDTVAWAWNVKRGDEVAYIYDRTDGVKTAAAQSQQEFPSTELYQTLSQASRLTKKTEKVYDASDTTKYLETVTSYEYSPTHIQLSEQITENSKGQEIKTKYYYPGDLSLSSTAETARLALITQNNVSAVLKQETLNESTQTSETKTNYKVFNTGGVMPEEIFHKNGSGSSESRVKFLKYDTKGNLISQQKTDDLITSYVWDYLYNLPIAEVVNADSATIAYSSFEADGKGGWTFSGAANNTYSMTGGKSYLVSGGNITRGSLTSATYIVSYWGKSGSVNVNGNAPTKSGKQVGDWRYYEHEVTTTSITVSGSNYIDELRLYPKGAMMKTYTYNPLIGVTTECDATNRILYYEYDNFNRLKIIKDEDGRIIKRIDYKYKAAYQD